MHSLCHQRQYRYLAIRCKDTVNHASFLPATGKSNFFYAIQFVLSDEYSHLRPEQRQVRKKRNM